MDTPANKRKHETAAEEENEDIGPTSKLPLNMGFTNKESNEHDVAGAYGRPEQSAPYDSNIVTEVLARSARFKNLKPEVVFKILGERHNFGYLKKIAISHLLANLKNRFDIFSQMIHYYEDTENNRDDELLFHSIFSWKWKDFLIRRKLTNFVWVDVLLRMKENRLHSYKFQKDLDELQWYLERIFEGLFSNIDAENINIHEHIEMPIDEAKKVLHTTDFVEDELKENYKQLKHLIYKGYFLTNARRSSEGRLLIIYLENRIWNCHIWDPIEVRYQINWFDNMVKQNKYHIDGVVEKIETDIANYTQMLSMEQMIDGNCMDFSYSSIESFKNRIAQMQEKFDKELDIIENKLIHIKLQTDKLVEQHSFLSDEIERFNEEEEQIRLEIQAEKYKEEQKRLRKSKAQAAKEEKRQKKKKGKR